MNTKFSLKHKGKTKHQKLKPKKLKKKLMPNFPVLYSLPLLLGC